MVLVTNDRKLHRFEYQPTMRWYECVDADLGSVDSGERCWPGCGAIIPLRVLRASGLPSEKPLLGSSLTQLVTPHNYGFGPQQVTDGSSNN